MIGNGDSAVVVSAPACVLRVDFVNEAIKHLSNLLINSSHIRQVSCVGNVVTGTKSTILILKVFLIQYISLHKHTATAKQS